MVYLFSFNQNIYIILAVLVIKLALYFCIMYGSIRYAFVDLFILEKNCTISQALVLSWDVTKGHFWRMMLFWCAMIILIILGVLAFFIGFFIAFPIVILMRAHLFKALLESK